MDVLFTLKKNPADTGGKTSPNSAIPDSLFLGLFSLVGNHGFHIVACKLVPAI